MKRIIVMRHAKSSWKDPSLDDHDRPLNKRGRKDCPKMARALIERGWIPQLVLSSTSQRTRETWQRMATEFDTSEIELQWLESFYHGGPVEVCRQLSKLDDSYSSIMVLGHNPGWEAIVETLCGKAVRMTTANAVLLEITSDSWQEKDYSFVDVLRPKELTDN